MTDDEIESAVAARLAQLGIPFERHVHPPVATVDEAVQHWGDIDATHCKNLFLRNQKGNRHYLVVLLHAKRADLRAVADQIGDGKLSFASPERLKTHLGLTPGSVSPFGLINDAAQTVRIVLDRDLKTASRVSFFCRFPLFCGMSEGAITWQSIPSCRSRRATPKPHGPAS